MQASMKRIEVSAVGLMIIVLTAKPSQCLDGYCNLILSDAVEIQGPHRRQFNIVMVPGKHLVKVSVQRSCLEGSNSNNGGHDMYM